MTQNKNRITCCFVTKNPSKHVSKTFYVEPDVPPYVEVRTIDINGTVRDYTAMNKFNTLRRRDEVVLYEKEGN